MFEDYLKTNSDPSAEFQFYLVIELEMFQQQFSLI